MELIKLQQAFWARMPLLLVLPYVLALGVGVVIEILATVYLPAARKPLYDSLEAYNQYQFFMATGMYCGVYLVLGTVQGFKTWLAQKIALLGREALMKTITKTWIKSGAKTKVTNPDSRINDDVRVATDGALTVGIELTISSFIVVGLTIGMMGQPLLLISALIYSLVSVGLALFFRSPLVNSRYSHLDAEGEHRAALTMISVGQGDYTSKDKWETIKVTFTQYINVLRNYKYFGAMQTAIMIGAPFFILAPEYFNHQITLGDVMKGVSAFDLLVINAAVWVQLYPQITDIQTAFIRVKEFYYDIH